MTTEGKEVPTTAPPKPTVEQAFQKATLIRKGQEYTSFFAGSQRLMTHFTGYIDEHYSKFHSVWGGWYRADTTERAVTFSRKNPRESQNRSGSESET